MFVEIICVMDDTIVITRINWMCFVNAYGYIGTFSW